MDDVTASLRLCLIGRKAELEHMLDVGIEDSDWYTVACKCFVLLDDIGEGERTHSEISQWQRLLDLTSTYEEEHYPFGN